MHQLAAGAHAPTEAEGFVQLSGTVVPSPLVLLASKGWSERAGVPQAGALTHRHLLHFSFLAGRMEDSSSAAAPKTPPILQLPDEVLCEILIAAGPSSAVRASKTCHRLHAILNTAATWKRFLATSGYPNHHEVEPEAARSVILEHYCRSCDTIVPRMFYTGNLCIACEYVQIKNEVWANEPMA